MHATVYLARHATPDWSRTDLRYDIPPGPPLTEAGEKEAQMLGQFLAASKVQRIYHSPLDRTTRTAALAAEVIGAAPEEDETLAEWQRGKPDSEILERIRPRVDAALDESLTQGPVVLVTHGGPVRLLLAAFGLEQAEIDFYRRQFDRDNPLPPAGVWRIARSVGGAIEQPQLVFTPKPYTEYAPETAQV